MSLISEFNKEKLLVTYDRTKQKSLVIKVKDLIDFESTYNLLSNESINPNYNTTVEVMIIKGIDGYKEYHPLKYYINDIDFIIESLNWIKGVEECATITGNSSSEKLISSYLFSKGLIFYIERANTVVNDFPYIEVILDKSHKELDTAKLDIIKKDLTALTGETIMIYFDNIKY